MITNLLKQFIPDWLYRLRHQIKHRRFRRRDNTSIFSEIYAQNLWGGREGEFHSGEGTVDENAKLYLTMLVDFLEKKGIQTVVEIGCGDFQLMKPLIEKSSLKYIGIDVASNLIEYLNQHFANTRVSFIHADAVDADLPNADVCIIRQVLQHLSNKQILSILDKIKQYPYTIITEHLLLGRDVVPNKNKHTGPDVRLYFNSGVFLEHPPFNQNIQILLEYPIDAKIFNKTKPTVFRTYLIKN